MIDSGRAARIDEDNNIIEHQEDDFANADAAKNETTADESVATARDDAIADGDDNISDNADAMRSQTDDDTIAGDTAAADDHDPENTST